MLIVFDLDDTLYLERDYVRSGFRAVGEWLASIHGISGAAALAWELFESGSRGHIFDEVLARIGANSPTLVRGMVAEYQRHAPSIELLPDARTLLSHCQMRQYSTALVTDGPSVAQHAKIDALRLTELIEHIVVTDDFGKEWWKPNPRAFELVQDTRPSFECIYLGDNPHKDFQAPSQLGWQPSLRVRRPGSLHESVPTLSDCIEIQSLSCAYRFLSLE